jgi:membrane-bound serine protease (ClpP class)
MFDWLLDPNVAYLVLIAGIWVSITAAYMPGSGILEAIAAGIVIGGVALLAMLPTNWIGAVILLIGAVIFFVLPFLKPRAALLALSGLVLQGIGSLTLFPTQPVSPVLIAIITLISLGYFYYLLLPALNTRWRKGEMLDDETMVGEIGEVVRRLDPVGVVRLRGETWTARAVPGESAIEVGQFVRVVEQQTLTLYVEPVKQKRIETSEAQEQDSEVIANGN